MGIKRCLIYSLDKEIHASYPEILTESALVLWFACQICLKFGLHVFSDWRTSRLDPDDYNYFDSLLELSGHKVNACFWDDVMSGWMQPHPLTVNQSALVGLVVAVPPKLTIFLGFTATWLTVVLTAILSISLVILVSANRLWTSPVSKDQMSHCFELAAFIQEQSRIAAIMHIPLDIMMLLYAVAVTGLFFLRFANCMVISAVLAVCVSWLAVRLIITVLDPSAVQSCCNVNTKMSSYVMIFMYAMTSAFSFTIYYGIWILFSAVPVVLLAWMAVVLAIAVCGPSAVFPGCIFFAASLTAYCAGRIWGLWMNDTYYAQIRKGIRTLTAGRFSAKSLSMDPSPKKAFAGTGEIQKAGPWKNACCSFVAFALGCIGVYYNVWSLYQLFPVVNQWQSNTGSANWTYWHCVNTTGTCSKHATGFEQGTAMLSYWVDLQTEELRSMHCSNSELLANFTPSFPSGTGWAFLGWCAGLSGASGIPFTALQYAEAYIVTIILVVIGGLLVRDGVRICYNKWHQRVVNDESLDFDDSDKSSKPVTLPVDLAAEETGTPDSSPLDHFPAPTQAEICTEPCYHSHGNDMAKQEIPGEKLMDLGAHVSIVCVPKALTSQPTSSCFCKRLRYCVFEGVNGVWLFLLAIHCPLIGLLLPYSLGGLFLPEQLHCPVFFCC
ncbi:uncharacterized protein LOC129596278 [Paramacrobiotus metropolitanus]|uniref:uncharacterized protein LOC129596278 n=1 Tax=Paramacrobiotus metropolitanus TaxID=2943436 RepID=UPI002445C3D4|nr:uncharacterized protein LOC129596278 [Paramacrobiotus metropolitanus]